MKHDPRFSIQIERKDRCIEIRCIEAPGADAGEKGRRVCSRRFS